MPTPAIELLPPEFDADVSGIPAWLLLHKMIPDGGMVNIYMTSPISKCYRYYTKDKECIITPEHPPAGTWEHRIGNKYQSQEADTPTVIWFCRGYCRELKRSVCWIIDSVTVMKAIRKAFSENKTIALDDNGVLNNICEIYHDKSAQASARYQTRFIAKPCEVAQVIESARAPWHPESYANGGGNPFEPMTAPPQQAGFAVPPTSNGTPITTVNTTAVPVSQNGTAPGDDW